MKGIYAYFAKSFSKDEMKQLPDDYRNWYCTKCYPEVLEAHWKLPWNRKKI